MNGKAVAHIEPVTPFANGVHSNPDKEINTITLIPLLLHYMYDILYNIRLYRAQTVTEQDIQLLVTRVGDLSLIEFLNAFKVTQLKVLSGWISGSDFLTRCCFVHPSRMSCSVFARHPIGSP